MGAAACRYQCIVFVRSLDKDSRGCVAPAAAAAPATVGGFALLTRAAGTESCSSSGNAGWSYSLAKSASDGRIRCADMARRWKTSALPVISLAELMKQNDASARFAGFATLRICEHLPSREVLPRPRDPSYAKPGSLRFSLCRCRPCTSGLPRTNRAGWSSSDSAFFPTSPFQIRKAVNHLRPSDRAAQDNHRPPVQCFLQPRMNGHVVDYLSRHRRERFSLVQRFETDSGSAGCHAGPGHRSSGFILLRSADGQFLGRLFATPRRQIL